ncbi:MAG TPA: FHA domain-containing protein [Anaerolineales bacterium]|nr:FHA domain-containing protein [Anaerolineales bacterium]
MIGEANEAPILVAQNGPLQGSHWRLERDLLLIGRGEDCDIVVPDRQISRYHARVRRTTDGFVLEDLGSKNGTHLNGVLVHSASPLQDGDVIQVAFALELAYVGREATMPLTRDERDGSPRLRMDSLSHRVWIGDRELDPPLSPPQYRLLDLLYRNGSRVVSRGDIVQAVWPEEEGEGVSEQAVDALVRRLRERLAEVDRERAYVVTVRGHGFRLDN